MDFSLAGRMLGALAIIAIVLFVAIYGTREHTTADQRWQSAPDFRSRNDATAECRFVARRKIAKRYVAIGRGGGHIAMLSDIPQAGIDAWLAAKPPNGSAVTRFAQLVSRIRTGGSA